MLQTSAVTYSYGYSTSTQSSGGGNAAILIPIIAVAIIFGIIQVVGMWKVFVKAGRPGWAAIIPIYNTYVLYEISGKPGWWVVFSFIPFVGALASVVLLIISMLELAKRFGKSSVFAIFGMVIFGFVGFPILGFGDAKYQVTGDTGEHRPFQATTDPPLPPVNVINPVSLPPQNPVTQAPAENVPGAEPKDPQPPTTPTV